MDLRFRLTPFHRFVDDDDDDEVEEEAGAGGGDGKRVSHAG